MNEQILYKVRDKFWTITLTTAIGVSVVSMLKHFEWTAFEVLLQTFTYMALTFGIAGIVWTIARVLLRWKTDIRDVVIAVFLIFTPVFITELA